MVYRPRTSRDGIDTSWANAAARPRDANHGHTGYNEATHNLEIYDAIAATWRVVESAASAELVDADVSAGAAIAWSKMAALASGHVLVGNGSGVAADVAMTGNVTITNAGVTAIAAGAVTGAKMAPTGIKSGSITALSSTSGSVTLTGAAVGDRVLAVFRMDAASTATGDGSIFESTITTSNAIQQTSSAGGTVKTFGVLLLPAAA